jgi:CheY-like chemotaxis protein
MTDRKLVLIAETAKTTLDMLSFLLSNRGYDIAQASTGRDALEFVKTYHPDLVVLGGELPEVTGYDVYRLLKLHPSTRHVPVLLLVAATDEIEAPTRTLPDPECLLSKPFTAHDFLERTLRVLALAPSPAPPTAASPAR